MMISSPRYTEDFIMRKLDESREKLDSGEDKYPSIYSIQLPTRKVKAPKPFELKEYFFFNYRTCEIVLGEEAQIRKDYKVNDITDAVFDYTYDVWQIPDTYKQSFLQNPEKAKRDF